MLDSELSLIAIGNSSAEAIEDALERLELPRERVKIEILGSNNSGKSRVKITPLLGLIPEPLHAGKILQALLEKMNIPADISIKIDNSKVIINIISQFSALIIGKNGTTIDSLQHIVNRMFFHLYGNKWKIILDAEGYRERKRINLLYIADETAEKVKMTGKSIKMIPLNPYDRRIVHIALEDDPDVLTESLGDGFLKNILISPA